ncbi:Odorant receptor [Camponotus japonicus]
MKILTLSFAISGVTIMSWPQIAYLLKHLDNLDLDGVFELMPTTSGALICAVKIISLTRNSGKFKVLLRQIYEDWRDLLTSQETQILTRYADNARKFTLVYSISIIGFVFCYAMLPLTAPILDIISPLNESRPKKMPHAAEFFVNQDKYYYVLLLNTYMGYVACVSIAVAADTIYVTLVEHICGMYDILCYRLENLITHDELEWIHYNHVYGHDKIGQRIRRCIQLHEKIRLLV